MRAGWSAGSVVDEPRDPVADLQREVRRRRAHELAHVLDGDVVVGDPAVGMLCFAHWLRMGEISRSSSIADCVASGTNVRSPTIQP